MVTKTQNVLSGDEPPFSEDQQKDLKAMMADAVKEVLQAEKEKSGSTTDNHTDPPPPDQPGHSRHTGKRE